MSCFLIKFDKNNRDDLKQEGNGQEALIVVRVCLEGEGLRITGTHPRVCRIHFASHCMQQLVVVVFCGGDAMHRIYRVAWVFSIYSTF